MAPPIRPASWPQILIGPGLAWLGTSVLWLLITRTKSPRISTPRHSATDFFGSFLDSWEALCEQYENICQTIRRLFELPSIGRWHFTPHLIHEPQILENIVLAVLAAACYGGGFLLIRRHQDSISRLWSLRFVIGVLLAVNAQFLAKIVWNRYAPAWQFAVNCFLMSLNWDLGSDAGYEMRSEFGINGLRSLGYTFDEKKDLEKSTDGATSLQSKS
jgi:hypothetical protein